MRKVKSQEISLVWLHRDDNKGILPCTWEVHGEQKLSIEKLGSLNSHIYSCQENQNK